MKLYFPFNNYQIPDDYGCNTVQHNNKDNINQHSFPFEIHSIPEKACFLAWHLIDWDTIPLIGFPWIHWSVANAKVERTDLAIPSDYSLNTSALQGENSLNSIVTNIINPFWRFNKNHRHYETHYSGPRPRIGTHNYRLTVYALSSPLELRNGFKLSDFMNSVDCNLLATTESNLAYTKKGSH